MTVLGLLVLAFGVVAWRQRRRAGAAERVPGRRSKRSAFLLVAGIAGFQMIIGAPSAMAQACAEAPNPERPESGMVAALDTPRETHGSLDTVYGQYAYAGQIWHVYEDNCGPIGKGVTDPNSAMDTWLGNQLFNAGKAFVAATNGLHYALAGDELMAPLDRVVENAAQLFYDNIYLQLFGLAAVILAVMLFRNIWRGDFASVSKRGLWALAAIWLATSFVFIGPIYREVESRFLNVTTQMQAGFLASNASEKDLHALPDALHDRVVYRNWLRGEFGSEDAPQALEFGDDLLAAQAWTKFDLPGPDFQARADAKKAAYKDIANKLGPAKGYFTGEDGSRTGAGALALFQGIAYSLFQLFAKLGVLLAQVLLRVFLLATPLIGLVAILHHEMLRKVGRAAATVLLNVLVLAALAGMHVLLLNAVFTAGDSLSQIARMAIAALITVIFFVICRPARRMWQMMELSVAAVSSAMPSAGPGLFSRFRRKGAERTPQDEFWDTVRETDTNQPVPDGPGTRRARPEAATVMVSAERMDRSSGVLSRPALTPVQRAAGIGPGASAAPGLPPAGGPGGFSGPTAALPAAGASRIVDTVPVADRGWDRNEDAVIVPSQVAAAQRGAESRPGLEPPPTSPRVAETEVVAGRPVHVLYRPSRGLEVRENTPARRLPRWDGPRDTDAAVR